MHVVSTITLAGEELEEYVHKCYHRDTYLQVYAPVFKLINGLTCGQKPTKCYLYLPKKLKLPRRAKKGKKEGSK